jgi:ATP-dependent exoDNAse (exonuclease V) beta subunit
MKTQTLKQKSRDEKKQKQKSDIPHVSFSELKNWHKCPFYHKLTYIDKHKFFKGNEYTAFGSAIHSVCEKLVLEDDLDFSEYFKRVFSQNIKDLLDKEVELRSDLITPMEEQGLGLIEHIKPALKEYFKSYEVISVEEKLSQYIKEFVEEEYNFKGYIDLVLKTKDGRYHVIDWKTCSWGWDARKKSEVMSTYQLIFYKHYYCDKYKIDPSNVDVHFGLLKRTAKKNKIELFKVTSGDKRTGNAINFLNKALYNINKKNYIKNKLACHGPYGPCEFYKTKHCP